MTAVKVIEFVSSQTKARLQLIVGKAEAAHLRRVEEGELTQKESTRILAWDLADIAKTLLSGYQGDRRTPGRPRVRSGVGPVIEAD
jgi:hypothetical protein